MFGSVSWPLLGFLEVSKRRRSLGAEKFLRDRECGKIYDGDS